MWYWIVMILLIAGSAAMLAVSFKSIKRNKSFAKHASVSGKRKNNAEEDVYDEENDIDGRRMNTGRPVGSGRGRSSRDRRRRRQRQWKIILEDIDNWDKYSVTFYDSVGFGRGKDGKRFERYLAFSGDGRISKIHCAILCQDDRLYLKDEGSRNGTYLNGERVSRPVLIQRNDIIGLGETQLEIQRILRESE